MLPALTVRQILEAGCVIERRFLLDAESLTETLHQPLPLGGEGKLVADVTAVQHHRRDLLLLEDLVHHVRHRDVALGLGYARRPDLVDPVGAEVERHRATVGLDLHIGEAEDPLAGECPGGVMAPEHSNRSAARCGEGGFSGEAQVLRLLDSRSLDQIHRVH
jgi:hypothetical protein